MCDRIPSNKHIISSRKNKSFNSIPVHTCGDVILSIFPSESSPEERLEKEQPINVETSACHSVRYRNKNVFYVWEKNDMSFILEAKTPLGFGTQIISPL